MQTVVKALVRIIEQMNACDDDVMDPDFAVSLMEECSAILQEMKGPEKKEFKAAIAQLTAKSRGKRKKFFADFLENAGLDDL